MTAVSALAARLTAFTLVLFATQPVRAQSIPGDSARLDSVRTALLQFPLGSPIRILTDGHNVIEGRLATVSDTGIVIGHRSDSSRASIARIATISRPARNLKSGAITGGVVGAIVGALGLGVLATGLCETDCHGAFGYGATIGAALGGGVGAAVGIGVGSLTHHWERVWP